MSKSISFAGFAEYCLYALQYQCVNMAFSVETFSPKSRFARHTPPPPHWLGTQTAKDAMESIRPELDKVMADFGIEIDDLWGVVWSQNNSDDIRADNKGDAYHYNGKGNELLGKAVADAIVFAHITDGGEVELQHVRNHEAETKVHFAALAHIVI